MRWLRWSQKEPEIVPKDQEQAQIPGKPKIILSLDRSWVNWIGLSWFTYMRLIRRAGGVPLRVHYGSGPETEDLEETVQQIIQSGDALLLSGGGDVDPALYGSDQPAKHVNSKRDRFELALIRRACENRKPVLGICRGCQLLNVAMGGTLQTIRTNPQQRMFHNRLRTHLVKIVPGSHLATMVQAASLGFIRSLHSQAVDRPGKGLRISGYAEDGVPESIESIALDEGHWIIGVQWHPELMPFKTQEHRLIDHFVQSSFLSGTQPVGV